MKLDGNILVLTQWSYKDALVQTYTLPYVSIIRKIVKPSNKIWVVTSEQEHIALQPDEIKAINNSWKQDNMELIAQPYKKFGLRKLLSSVTQLYKLYRTVKRNKVDVIHAFCTPAGSIGYLLSKLTGKSLVIDSYEPHAESMVENGTWKKSGLAYKLLSKFEKAQTKRAAHLIATTEGMRDYAKNRFGVYVKSFFVKPACVDLEKFSPEKKNESIRKELGLENKIVCVYAGKLGGIYLKDEVFDLIKACYEKWGNNFRFLMLSNTSKDEINFQLKRTGIPPDVIINKFIPHNDVPAHLALADFAINPVKPVPTKKYCTSIKDGEYWATGLPVVISPGISDDSSIIQNEQIGFVIDFYDSAELKNVVEKLDYLFSDVKNRPTQKIRSVAEKYRSYNIARKIYNNIYN